VSRYYVVCVDNLDASALHVYLRNGDYSFRIQYDLPEAKSMVAVFKAGWQSGYKAGKCQSIWRRLFGPEEC